MRSSIDLITAKIRKGGSLQLTGLDGSAAAMVISMIHLKSPRPFLVICPTVPATSAFHRDLEYFSAGHTPVKAIPAYEILPFEEETPSPDIVAARLSGLYDLARGTEGIYIAHASILAQRLMPAEDLLSAAILLRPGERADPEELAVRLTLMGYRRADLTEAPGEFSRRGSILDIYSPGWKDPLRLDLMGDTLEELRWFDPSDQRSLSSTDEALVLPASEIPGDGRAETFAARGEFFAPGPGRETTLKQIHAEMEDLGPRPWMVSLLPLFYENPQTVFDYCTPETMVVLLDPGEVFHQADSHLEEIGRRSVEQEFGDTFRKNFSREVSAALEEARGERPRGLDTLEISPFGSRGASPGGVHLPGSAVRERLAGRGPRGTGGWPALEQIRSWQEGSRVIFVSRTAGSAQRLIDILREYDLGARLMEGLSFDPDWVWEGDNSFLVHTGQLTAGFQIPEFGVTFISEEDLFGPRTRSRELQRARSDFLQLDFASLNRGDYLVHEENGIGVYAGVTRLGVNGRQEDMLTLTYADGGRLYIPMDRLYLVQKYVFTKGHKPKVDQLGGRSWSRAKTRARKAARKVVREMLRLQARRQMQKGFAFSPDGSWQKEFEASFGYEETEDQWLSIEEVKKDMESPRAMDRLVCGDVGYGKTEVALRAAFKAVNDGRQVALLAPTTVLCQQHFLTFHHRLAPFPVEVGVLSRFTPQAELKRAMEGAAQGTVDIVIGTHRLLQKDVAFKNLGLLIIDEEHRFGVRHKERMKELRTNVDVLTLSATPIPRTFYMSMSGLRDLSIIETPPESRLAIKTRVLPYDEEVVGKAIKREMARGGQVFFLHNRVMNIDTMARRVSAIAPEARVAVAHGQMNEKKLEGIMSAFVAGEYDVLVCTTIIQSGLDISNANTMIIHQAERFGLADLYQLRGRIGRSSHQAYAYMMISPGRLTPTAGRRLKAIEEFSDLGAGVKIAALDLEIRGAGNLMGYEQSGRMADVGLEMYSRILEETVSEPRGAPSPGTTTALP